MNTTRHFFYWILPTGFVLALVMLYFTGGPVARSVLAPGFNRELGVLESTQHLLILAVLLVVWRGFRNARDAWERLGFGLVFALGSFQLLEEINYGQHYLMALQGIPRDGFARAWSLHNQGGNSSRIKTFSDIVMAVYFVVLPLVANRRFPAWLRYLAPPRLMVATILCMVLVSKLAHRLNDAQVLADHQLGNSISEFREIFVYYIGLLYVYELVYRRHWPGWKGERADPPRNPRS
jgi:hypothetical protein